MAEVVHVAAASLGAKQAGDLERVARCGARVPSGLEWPDIVTRFDLRALQRLLSPDQVTDLITCEACKAALVQEALERTG